MAKGKRIKKQLFYKHARFLQPTTETLQTLFDKAIKAVTVEHRAESVSVPDANGVSQSFRLVNSPRIYSGFNFAVMVMYSPGIHHMVIDLAVAAGKDEMDVSKLPPPAGKQFMESPLYFAIRDNHIVLIQSVALRTKDLEEHLNWLLVQAGAIESEDRIELSDEIPEVTRKRIEKEPVRSIRIGGPLVDSPATISVADKISGAVSKAASGLGLDMIRGWLTDSEYAGLKLDELTESPNIEVNVEIKVTGKKKKKDAVKGDSVQAVESEVMSGLMRELRHVEDVGFLRVTTKGGGHLDGNDLRVQNNVTIASHDGVLETADAFESMRKWLVTLVDSGTIPIDG